MEIQNFQDGELGGVIREKINTNFTNIRETLKPISYPMGEWAPNTYYTYEEGVRRDSVIGPEGTIYAGKSYVATETHTSGNTFQLKQDGGFWILSSLASSSYIEELTLAAEEAREGSDLALAQTISTGATVVSQAEAARDEAEDAQAAAAASEARAEASEAQAEAARDAAYVNADVYASTAAGLAAVALGVQFQVASADGLTMQRYQHDAGPVATPVGPPLPTVNTTEIIRSRAMQPATIETEIPWAVLGKRTGRKWLWIEDGDLYQPGLNISDASRRAPKVLVLPDVSDPILFAVLSPKGRIGFISRASDQSGDGAAQAFGARAQYATDVERLQDRDLTPFEPEHAAVSSEVTFWTGRSAYKDQRIPTIEFNTATETLHLAYEARTGGDYDYAVLAYKRKLKGAPWQVTETILAEDPAEIGLFQAPCFVYDRTTGRLWLHFKWLPQETETIQSRDVDPTRSYEPRALYSDDDGVTWKGAAGATWVPGTSTQADAISLSYLKPGNWYRWSTLGNGINLDDGTLVVPCWARIGTDGTQNSCGLVLWYDRSEANVDLAWKRSATTDLGEPFTETAVVAAGDGSLILNSRPASGDYRVETRSVGNTGMDRFAWRMPVVRTDLPDPRCQGSLLRLAPTVGWPYNRILFSNCALTYTEDGGHRHKLTVRLSYDDTATFERSVQLFPTQETLTEDSYGNTLAEPKIDFERLFGYSVMTRMRGDQFAYAFESYDIAPDGSTHLYRVIDVAILDLKFLLGEAP
jgi:sialidase-1